MLNLIHILIAAVVFGCDQLMKLWTVKNIPLGGVREFLPGLLTLRHEHNTGAALSIMNEHTWILTGVSIALSVLLVVLILSKGFTFREKLCLGMILGGAVGNGIDRLLLGYVVDMFIFDFFPVFVFNVADAFIDVAAILFAIFYLVRTAKEEKMRTGPMPELQRLKKEPEDTAGED